MYHIFESTSNKARYFIESIQKKYTIWISVNDQFGKSAKKWNVDAIVKFTMYTIRTSEKKHRYLAFLSIS
jgi:hypothetical protein